MKVRYRPGCSIADLSVLFDENSEFDRELMDTIVGSGDLAVVELDVNVGYNLVYLGWRFFSSQGSTKCEMKKLKV